MGFKDQFCHECNAGFEYHEVRQGHEGHEGHGTWHIIKHNVGASKGRYFYS